MHDISHLGWQQGVTAPSQDDLGLLCVVHTALWSALAPWMEMRWHSSVILQSQRQAFTCRTQSSKAQLLPTLRCPSPLAPQVLLP
jgi:hypothetical protein